MIATRISQPRMNGVSGWTRLVCFVADSRAAALSAGSIGPLVSDPPCDPLACPEPVEGHRAPPRRVLGVTRCALSRPKGIVLCITAGDGSTTSSRG